MKKQFPTQRTAWFGSVNEFRYRRDACPTVDGAVEGLAGWRKEIVEFDQAGRGRGLRVRFSRLLSAFPYLLCQVMLLLAPRRFHGFRPLDHLSVKGFSGQRDGDVPALNIRLLGVEVENHIGVPVTIDIFQGKVYGGSLGATRTEEDCGWIHGGGIKSVSRE